MVKRLLRKPKRFNYKREKLLMMREQTILSKERTVLSFMRTGLASIGAGIVIINIFSTNPASIVIGWAFILTGIVEIAESYRRLRGYQRKMKEIKSKMSDDI